MKIYDAPLKLLKYIKRFEKKDSPEKTPSIIDHSLATINRQNSTLNKIISSDKKSHKIRKNFHSKKAPSKNSSGIRWISLQCLKIQKPYFKEMNNQATAVPCHHHLLV